MDGESFAFPDRSAVCSADDFLVCQDRDRRWRVHRVDDLVTLKRLVPVLDDPSALMVEGNLLDSMTPAYHGQVHLLLTAYDPPFPDEAAALTAIQQQTLTVRAQGLLRDAAEFPRSGCRVVRPSDRE
jgi:hypothetical protein